MRFSNERVLAVTRNMFTDPADFRSLFGDYRFCSPRRLANLSLTDVKQGGFDRIVFANPYMNDQTRRIYRACRENAFRYLVCERGALPGTVLLDETGFLADSSVYDPSYWRQLKIVNPGATLAALREIYFGRRDLEPQAAPYSQLRRTAARRSRPRVLIALQDSQDTAVRAFAGPGRTYAEFLQFVDALCSTYGTDFEFVCKPHPREPAQTVASASSVAGLHILNALEQVDAVITFSSGVGALAMLMGLPVGFFGKPFYRRCGAARDVPDNAAFEVFAASLDGGGCLTEAARFMTHLSLIYSDVDFYSRGWSRQIRRDVLCKFRMIRFMDRDGWIEQCATRPQAIPLFLAEALLRAAKNRTGIGADNW